VLEAGPTTCSPIQSYAHRAEFPDVTDRKQLEEQFLQSQKVQAMGNSPAAWLTIQ